MSKELELFEFIKGFIDEHGYAPSYSEMMKGAGISTKGTIHNRINRLVKDGMISQVPGISRSIRVRES